MSPDTAPAGRSTPIKIEDEKELLIDLDALKESSFYFVLTPICPSEPSGQARVAFGPNAPTHIFKDDDKKSWGLTHNLHTFIYPKDRKVYLHKLQEVSEFVCPELQEELAELYKKQKKQATFCTFLVPPCSCVIHDALIVSNNAPYIDRLEYIVRIDERIPTTCCRREDQLERLRTLATTLREFDEGKRAGFKKGRYLAKIDLPYLEKRIRTLELEDCHREQEGFSCTGVQVSELLMEQAKHHGNIIYMGEAKSCGWILKSPPFAHSWSARPPAAKEIFRLNRDAGRDEIEVEFLATYTCVPSSD
ncbi:hypothetical protein V8F20_006930 [Naviculisporaceae sp. PSN 640]